MAATDISLGMIEYRDIHKAFDAPVLSGVELSVQTGECLSIVGTSGTSKSVLLKTTNGLLFPDRGDVLIDGQSVFSSGRHALERIRDALRGLRFGTVTVIVQDGVIVQVGRTERLRLLRRAQE